MQSGDADPRGSQNVSNRAAHIKPFIAMEIMSEAMRLEQEPSPPGGRILHLEIGQPSAPPPKAVIHALLNLHEQPLGYTPALGLPSLRTAIAGHYQRTYGADVQARHVAVTTGASGAFVAAFSVLFDAGQRVAVAAPGYPCYRHVLNALGVDVAIVSTEASTGFQPTVPQLQQEHTRQPVAGVLLASPGNPAGSLLTLTQLQDMAEWCGREGIKLIVDEVYHGIWRTVVGSATQLKAKGVVVVIGSMSKYWCMTGFRVGWAIVREADIMSAMERCMQNMAICAPTPSQRLAEVAVSGACDAELDAIVSDYFNAAEALVSWLLRAGFKAAVPAGSFYVYAQCDTVCSRVGVDGAQTLCKKLLRECGVACTPGVDFDEEGGESFVRFSCAGARSAVEEAGQRISRFVEQFSQAPAV